MEVDNLKTTIDKEIEWCESNLSAEGSPVSPEYKLGFIAGLEQAKLFASINLPE